MREVHLAAVEHDGHVSVLKHSWAEGAQRADVDKDEAAARAGAIGDSEPPEEKRTDSAKALVSPSMDPLRIVVRALSAYVILLIVIRLSGKRTVRHGSMLEFTIALVLGDLVDDMIWTEVPVGQFIAAVGALFTVHLALDVARFKSSLRSLRTPTTSTTGRR